MDRDKLLELKNAAEQKSLALNDRRTELQKELDNVTTDLVRLQGDYRTYEQLIAEFEEPKLGIVGDVLQPAVTNVEKKDEDGSTTTE